jgi:hypothetical protein
MANPVTPAPVVLVCPVDYMTRHHYAVRSDPRNTVPACPNPHRHPVRLVRIDRYAAAERRRELYRS